MRKLALALALVLAALAALAGRAGACSPLPFNLQNGTLADATQVMANFNALLGCVNASPSLNSRVKLVAPLTLYVGTAGVDANNACTNIASPCKNASRALSVLQAGYDTNGQNVTVKFGAGTHTGGVLVSGPMVGQTSPHQLLFLGDPAAPGSYIIEPSNGAHAMGCNFGAQIAVSGLTLRQGAAWLGRDISTATTGCELWFDDNFVIGDTLNPGTDIITAQGGRVFIASSYTISKTSYTIACNAFGGGVSTLTCVSASAASLKIFQGLQGAGIVNGTYITSVSVVGTTATVGISQATSGAGATVTFSNGGVSHVTAGAVSSINYLTDNTSGGDIQVAVNGAPFYYNGFATVNELGYIGAQAIQWRPNGGEPVPGGAHGPQFSALRGGIIDTDYGGCPYFPGDFITGSATFAATDTQITLAAPVAAIRVGMGVNGYTTTTATYSALSSDIVVASATHIEFPVKVFGKGIRQGTFVTNVVGTTVTLSIPTTLAGTAETLYFVGAGIRPSTYVTFVNAAHDQIYLSFPAVTAKTGVGLAFCGLSGSMIGTSDGYPFNPQVQ